MKHRTTYVLFIDLLSSWSEHYRSKGTAEDTLKKVRETIPHPPTHAKLRLEEVEPRKSIKVIEEWQNQDGQWVRTI